MACPGAIEDLLRRVTREIRRRRAEQVGLRGAFWGAVAAGLVLLAKGPLGPAAVPLAAVLPVLGGLAGAAWGACRRVRSADAAWVVDRAFDLADRVSTTLEWVERPDRTPLVDALVADTAARVEALPPRRAVARTVPREARWLPVPVLAAVVLALAPALPTPSGLLPGFLASDEPETQEERTAAGLVEERTRPVARDPLKRTLEERDFAQHAGGSGAAAAGDLAAVFRDTALATQRPDFNSFLKKGDDRLRLLEQVDRLPDLQSDVTQTPYRVIFRKSRQLSAGLSPDQISPQKLRELLEEMERLGRKGGTWAGDAAEGMEALEYGSTDRALEAMRKALDKMRAMEEAKRGGRGLRGGREAARGQRRELGPGDGPGGPEDMDFSEGEGLLPGRGRSPNPKGEATRRLQASPYDVGVEGQTRRGRKEGYDTNLAGRSGPMASRLHYLGIIGSYRKQMEDALAREQVPRDYHDQIRDYFQALDER